MGLEDLERPGIDILDEGVEKDGGQGHRGANSKTPGSKLIWPDLDGI